jgi:hypothetical protein
MSPMGRRTDAELAQLDLPAMLRSGLGRPDSDERRSLFGDGAVGAAVILDSQQVIPRSLTYLAELVRAGGTRRAANLTEPLPEPEQTETIRPWLDAAADTASTVDDDEDVALWLEAVASIVALRLVDRQN